jgi:hypothetical protein
MSVELDLGGSPRGFAYPGGTPRGFAMGVVKLPLP